MTVDLLFGRPLQPLPTVAIVASALFAVLNLYLVASEEEFG